MRVSREYQAHETNTLSPSSSRSMRVNEQAIAICSGVTADPSSHLLPPTHISSPFFNVKGLGSSLDYVKSRCGPDGFNILRRYFSFLHCKRKHVGFLTELYPYTITVARYSKMLFLNPETIPKVKHPNIQQSQLLNIAVQ